uniref:Uncharacterized protein n=2 Tax=Haplochromini TaxID=319058 RepID=A0A3Q2WIC6_HAPBU
MASLCSAEKLTMLLMKLSLIITCLIFFQSLVSSPSIRQIDSRASLTAAGGLVIARTSTRCCRLIELTHQWFVLGQPCVKQSFMANSVQGRNNNIWGCHLVGFHFNLGHFALPGLPLP